ncbi:hypothetical protein PMYN1_Chma477 (chromatophore) [Paulinella micropora]|uniref:DUF565 domain-containing protein n=1 Tax=Paulinella micropora TaxID=1928728 RepID=A0A5K7W2U7_9EUKA|nr:hypothetical protein PMYN1_Chma477 [Paulinella micropora]
MAFNYNLSSILFFFYSIKPLQKTRLRQKFTQLFQGFIIWVANPWRRISLLTITLLIGFFLGTIIGTVSGALSVMDTTGALVVVLFIEVALRVRRHMYYSFNQRLPLHMLDMFRIGLLYGLLLEGFKLL